MTKHDEDLPKLIASIGWMIPSLTIKTGWAYLKMKKKAQRVSKHVERGMIENGLPREYAKKLAEEFASQLSVKNFVRQGRFFDRGMLDKNP